MSESDARSQLIEAFKNCLNHSAKGQLDFAGKYVELACHDGDATIIWSLNQKWFLEGELYDYNKSYQQRKVVANVRISKVTGSTHLFQLYWIT